MTASSDPAAQPPSAAATGPAGELVIRTIAMPADTNANGDIFGGWLMAQMDLGGAILARQIASSRITTVAVEAMSFHAPVHVGDIVACYAQLLRIGRTSMRIDVQVWVQRADGKQLERVTEGVFTYVALDPTGRPWPVRREPVDGGAEVNTSSAAR
jgi:acyl-CoA thioesterase YciA